MIIKEQIKKADGSIKYRNYAKKEKLGSGGFADCFLVERIQDKKQFALKIVPKKMLAKSKARQKMLSEIKLHRSAKHTNICDLQRAFENEQHVYMLLELCKNKNMFDLMKRRKRLTIPETQLFIYELINALCYLHRQQIIHRDVKLGNLLIDDKMHLKLADFGLATKVEFQGDRKHTVCGTPNYIAPEVIRSSMGLGHSGHSYEVDIWGTGVIMYIMLIGKAPFETSRVERTYERISTGDFSFPDSFKDESAKHLLRNILVVDISKRYTFQEILQHPFMNPKAGIPKELPHTSMVTAPKFGIFQKYAMEEVKKTARDASVTTLRSSIENSLDEDFGAEVYTISNTSRHDNTVLTARSKSKSKEVRDLLRSSQSTSSLHKALQKLSYLSRNVSPQVKSYKSIQSPSLIMSSGPRQQQKLAISSFTTRLNTTDQASDFPSKNQFNESLRSQGEGRHGNRHMQIPIITEKKVVKGPAFILSYRKEVIWSYLLNNGSIGTYETDSNYKLLYNKADKLYLEVVNDGAIKKIKLDNATLNQNISNRLKFLESYADNQIPCEPYSSTQKVVYLRKVFEVRPENLILFKFSNDSIQAFNYETNYSLIVSSDELHLVEIKGQREVSRVSEKKDKYTECKNKTLISMYLKVKKILFKIHNAGKG